MRRKIGKQGVILLKNWEGRRGLAVLTAYRDGGGVPTIGFGHTNGVVMGMSCTPEQAERWLQEDVREAENAVNKLVKVPLNEFQFDALVCFVFNVGVGAFAKSTLLRVLNAGGYAAVPGQMLRWVKDVNPRTGKMVTVPGLVNRRSAEIALWSTEVPGALAMDFAPAARPVAPPAPTKLLQTSTGKVQATALAGGGAAAAIEVASKVSLMDSFREAMDQLQPLAYIMEGVQFILVAGTLGMIAYTLWDRRKKLKENGS